MHAYFATVGKYDPVSRASIYDARKSTDEMLKLTHFTNINTIQWSII